MDMDFILIKISILEVLKQKVAGIGIRNVHGFLENVT